MQPHPSAGLPAPPLPCLTASSLGLTHWGCWSLSPGQGSSLPSSFMSRWWPGLGWASSSANPSQLLGSFPPITPLTPAPCHVWLELGFALQTFLLLSSPLHPSSCISRVSSPCLHPPCPVTWSCPRRLPLLCHICSDRPQTSPKPPRLCCLCAQSLNPAVGRHSGRSDFDDEISRTYSVKPDKDKAGLAPEPAFVTRETLPSVIRCQRAGKSPG